MFKVGLCLPDETQPRTEYWERFLKSVRSNPAFTTSSADLLIPEEDTSIETNWPRYGRAESAYIRGTGHDLNEAGGFHKYYERVVALAKSQPRQSFLFLSMHPFIRMPLMFRPLKNVIVADPGLARFERDLNPSTISMPALPIITGVDPKPGLRPIMASFQGVISHPVRQILRGVHNGTSIIVNIVERSRHVGKLDATNETVDREYGKMFEKSNFALLPRGDALYFYRLLESMSYGCIPVIMSDGWVLPFDRIVNWGEFSISLHVDAIEHIPLILSQLTPDEILERQAKTIAAYNTHFATLDKMVASALREAELICHAGNA